MPRAKTRAETPTFDQIRQGLDGSFARMLDDFFSQLQDPRGRSRWRPDDFYYNYGYGPERDWLEDHQAEIRAMARDYEERYDGDIDQVRIEDLGGDIYHTRWGLIQTKTKGQAFIKGADAFGREQWTPNVIRLDKGTLLDEGLEESRQYFEEEAAHVLAQKKYAKQFDLSLAELNVLQPFIEGQIDHFYNSEEDDREQSIILPGQKPTPVPEEKRLYNNFIEGEFDLEEYVRHRRPEFYAVVDPEKMAQFLDATHEEFARKVNQEQVPAYEHEVDPDGYSDEELAEVDLYLDGREMEYTEAAATDQQLEDEFARSQAHGGPITIEIE